MRISHFISHVVIYKGHQKYPTSTPYIESVHKRFDMFKELNRYRKEVKKPEWSVSLISGEHLLSHLKQRPPEKTLLVIPAGPTKKLDDSFTLEETHALRHQFFEKGGKGYFNCGSAYWVSRRIYQDPTHTKISKLSLFEGLAVGPLAIQDNSKGEPYFTAAMGIKDDIGEVCHLCLSGGGSFISDPNSRQQVSVLGRYLPDELALFGRSTLYENAIILASIGKGKILLSSTHPYYGANDINVEAYQKAFPNSGTNWQQVKDKLSSHEVRMRFANRMLSHLET